MAIEELQPPLMGQSLLHRQSRPYPGRRRHGHHHGAEASGPADVGGYPVTFVTGRALGSERYDNYYTFAKDFGDVTTYWHGVDFTV